MNDFAKYHALGNDYVLVDPVAIEGADLPAAARLLCDRRLGIGGDGLMVGPLGPVRPCEPVELRLFNPDGSACERSGNGMRMFALHLMQHHGTGPRVVLRTAAGDAPVEVLDADAGLVRIGTGTPSFQPADVPVLGMPAPTVARPLIVDGRELTVTCLNNGNPHAVVTPPDRAPVTPELARRLGPLVAGHARFPSRTNVQFLTVLDRAAIRIEIFERGAGYTPASGASACAAASAAREQGLVDGHVDVHMSGGTVTVDIDGAGAVTLTGVVRPVVTGRFASALRAQLGARPPHRKHLTEGEPP
jgi:diaminopimelate epimerase